MSTTAPGPYKEGFRHAEVTFDNQGAILQIAAWFLMVVMILATFLRLTIRFTTRQVPGLDDTILIVAMCLGIGQVIAVSIGVNTGLGKRFSLLSGAQINSVEKDVYVSTLLYLLTIASAKASTLLLIGRLANDIRHVRTVHILSATVLLWTIASLFGVAFACQLPRPWAYTGEKCFDTTAFWDAIGMFDIVTDITLIALPTVVIWDLRMNWQTKLVVVSAFAFRILAVAAQIARLIFLRQLRWSTDLTYVMAYGIATQCQMTLAVVTASIPALKPFMDLAASGLIAASLGQRGGTYGISGTFAMPELSKSQDADSSGNKKTPISTSELNEEVMKPENLKASLRPDCAEYHAAISALNLNSVNEGTKQHNYRKGENGSDKVTIHKTISLDAQCNNESRCDHRNPQSMERHIDNSSPKTHYTQALI